MSWFGKIIGGALGFMMGGGFLGMILGAALGHNFDRGLGITGGVDASRRERKQIAFYVATFSVMGHLCKADGRVSEAEIERARWIMGRMSLDAEMRQLAMKLFNQGKEQDFDLVAAINDFRQEIGRQPNMYRMFMEIQIMAAYADGTLHREELSILRHICQLLHVTTEEFEYLCRLVSSGLGAGGGHRDTSGTDVDAMSPARARQILGVSDDANRTQVKRAYRRLMNRHHPDKLVAKGMPEEMVQVATQRTIEIRRAYDCLK